MWHKGNFCSLLVTMSTHATTMENSMVKFALNIENRTYYIIQPIPFLGICLKKTNVFFLMLFISDFHWGSNGKDLPASARDPGFIPGLEGNDNPLWILAWEFPWTGIHKSQTVRDNLATKQNQTSIHNNSHISNVAFETTLMKCREHFF